MPKETHYVIVNLPSRCRIQSALPLSDMADLIASVHSLQPPYLSGSAGPPGPKHNLHKL